MTHPLKKFRDENKLKASDFAALAEVSRMSLNRIERGEQTPSLDLAYRIEQLTKGAVTASELAQAVAKEPLS